MQESDFTVPSEILLLKVPLKKYINTIQVSKERGNSIEYSKKEGKHERRE
jgi:hypothetical protein